MTISHITREEKMLEDETVKLACIVTLAYIQVFTTDKTQAYIQISPETSIPNYLDFIQNGRSHEGKCFFMFDHRKFCNHPNKPTQEAENYEKHESDYIEFFAQQIALMPYDLVVRTTSSKEYAKKYYDGIVKKLESLYTAVLSFASYS